MDNIKNKTVYQMYNGKMCMRHTIEMFTPIVDEELGTKMYIGQMEHSEAHKQSMHDINNKIQDILMDNLSVDVGKVETTVMLGEVLEGLE